MVRGQMFGQICLYGPRNRQNDVGATANHIKPATEVPRGLGIEPFGMSQRKQVVNNGCDFRARCVPATKLPFMAEKQVRGEIKAKEGVAGAQVQATARRWERV